MAEYGVGGRSTATAATANVAAAQLWNPHTTQRVGVVKFGYAVTTAGVANLALRRSTARGTATTTVTPNTVDADFGRSVTSPAGILLDLAFSAQPTLAGVAMYNWNTPAVIGAGLIDTFADELIIPPGTGLVITTPTAVIFPASDVFFIWRE